MASEHRTCRQRQGSSLTHPAHPCPRATLSRHQRLQSPQASLAWPMPSEVPVTSLIWFQRRHSPLHPKSMGALGIAKRINSGTLPPSHLGFLFHRGRKEAKEQGFLGKGWKKAFLGEGREMKLFSSMRKVLEEEIRQVRGRDGVRGEHEAKQGAGKLQWCMCGARASMAWVGGLSSHGGLERCPRWGSAVPGAGGKGMAGAGGCAPRGRSAGGGGGRAGGGCSRGGALPRAGGKGCPERVPRGDGGRYLKLGGEARCSPRKGEEAGGDAAPFSRSAILWLSPCRRRAGGREGGREGGMKGGGCWRCRRGGTYLPPGRGKRGRGPEAPSCGSGGSCGTGTAQMEASPRTPTPSAPPGARGTPAPAGQMCPQLEAAPLRAGTGDGRALPRPGGATPGAGLAG